MVNLLGHTIRTRLATGALGFFAILVATTFVSLRMAETYLEESFGHGMVATTQAVIGDLSGQIASRLELLRQTSLDKSFQDVLAESNAYFQTTPGAALEIMSREMEWIQTPRGGETPLAESVVHNRLSDLLRERFIDFYRRQHGYNILEEVLVTDRAGALVASTGKSENYYQASEEWWIKAMESGVHVGDVAYDRSLDGYGLSLAVRLDDAEGKGMGVIKAVLSPRWIMREAQYIMGRDAAAQFRLTTRQGRLLYSTKPFRFHEDVSGQPYFQAASGDSGHFILSESGMDRFFAYATAKGLRNLEDMDWVLFAVRDVDEVMQPLFLLRQNMFVAFGCLALAWLVVAVFVARTITGPVDRLRRAVAGVAEGDLTSRVRVEGKDELAGLGRAFNEMTEALQASRQALDQEILERKQAEERIRYLAMHDALTDLPTRRLLSDRMRQALAAARRKKEMVAVLYVDLDGFKQINDRHGHQVGDAVLEEVARRLRSNLRATDTAARVGGDEFAVVLPEITDRGDAALVARKIIESFSRPIVASGGEYAVGASVGVSFYPRDGETLGVLLNEADRAMYKAKKKGGNTIYLAGE